MGYIYQAQKNSSLANPHLLELHINSLLNSCLVKHVNPTIASHSHKAKKYTVVLGHQGNGQKQLFKQYLPFHSASAAFPRTAGTPNPNKISVSPSRSFDSVVKTNLSYYLSWLQLSWLLVKMH